MLLFCQHIIKRGQTSSNTSQLYPQDLQAFTKSLSGDHKKLFRKKYIEKEGQQYYLTWIQEGSADVIVLQRDKFISKYGSSQTFIKLGQTYDNLVKRSKKGLKKSEGAASSTKNINPKLNKVLSKNSAALVVENEEDQVVVRYEEGTTTANITFLDSVNIGDEEVKSSYERLAEYEFCQDGEVRSSNPLHVIESNTIGEDLEDFFYNPKPSATSLKKNSFLLGESSLSSWDATILDRGYLGKVVLTNGSDSTDSDSGVDEHIYLNVSQPFCLVCVGVQGAGKSHTMNVALENCLLNFPLPQDRNLIQLSVPMCALVLHYDQSPTNICEAIGLHDLSKKVRKFSGIHEESIGLVDKMVVLVSPSYYKQRKQFYGSTSFEVVPPLFNWSSLKAQQLKKLMRLSEGDSQLFVSVILNLLREYQREDAVPVFGDFLKKIESLCSVQGQSGPLKQRIQLLKSMVKESELNESLSANYVSLGDLMDSGVVIIADMTDPMLSADEANGIFQVLLEQFRTKPLTSGIGKVVAFDEAHKYLSSSGGSARDELADAIVDTVRLMRHEGIRILISTQSPLTLPPELLELVSVTVVHHFQSKDWYTFLSSKIPLHENGFEEIKRLSVGEGLFITTKMDANLLRNDHGEDEDSISSTCQTCVKLRVRPRLTWDYGSSKVNQKSVV